MLWSEVWNGDSVSDRLLRIALTPASWLYGAGWQGYLGIYRLGLKTPREPHVPILCVGNLVVGGSGKSPLALHIAQVLKEIGYEVVLGASGYGGPHAEAAALAPEGQLSAREWGDEPAMHRWLAPDLPLIVGRRRLLAAEICRRKYPNAVLIMDDGFQHMPLKKHLSIVLDDPAPRNTRCLPAGPYREPRRNRMRADLVLPGAFEVSSAPLQLIAPEGTEASPEKYSVLCALGQPEKFLASLRAAFPVAHSTTLLLRDHDPLDAGNLLERLPADSPVVVTAKDWVKLRERPDVGSRVFLVAMHTVRVEPANGFQSWIQTALDGIKKQSATQPL